MRKTYFFLFAALGWFIISVVLLALPGTAFPKEDWLDKIWFDKWVHIGMFSILAALWCRYWYLFKLSEYLYRFRRAFIVIGLICLSYGIAMEFVQKYFIPFRSFDIGDIIADGVGATIGSIFSMRRYIKK